MKPILNTFGCHSNHLCGPLPIKQDFGTARFPAKPISKPCACYLNRLRNRIWLLLTPISIRFVCLRTAHQTAWLPMNPRVRSWSVVSETVFETFGWHRNRFWNRPFATWTKLKRFSKLRLSVKPVLTNYFHIWNRRVAVETVLLIEADETDFEIVHSSMSHETDWQPARLLIKPILDSPVVNETFTETAFSVANKTTEPSLKPLMCQWNCDYENVDLPMM